MIVIKSLVKIYSPLISYFKYKTQKQNIKTRMLWPETATCKTELLRFPSSSAIAFHILSWYNKSYISLQQPRTDFYIGIGYSPPPSPHPQEQNKTKQNNCFLTFNMSGRCQTLFMESQKSLLFLCKREVRSSRECFRTFISLEMT